MKLVVLTEKKLKSIDGEDSVERMMMEGDSSGSKQAGYRCELCGKTYSCSSSFTEHRRFHRGEFVCPVCGRQLSKKSHLNRHIRTVHGSEPSVSSFVVITTRAGGNQLQREDVDVKPPPPQLKQKVTKTSNRFLKATETKRIIPKNPLALESEPKETIEGKKEGVVPPLKQIKKEDATAGAVDISANGKPEVGDKNGEKTGGEAEKCLSDEDCKAEQIRIRFEQEEFMSRLDLLRNPPPNVPITLPSLRPIPKLQRGSQSLSAAGTTTTVTTNSSSGSARNFSGGVLGHNLSFSTPNFSISQQLLRSAKATARAKDARSLSLSGGLNTRNTSSSSASSKLSNAVGKGILHGAAAAAAAAASTCSNTKALVPKPKVITMEENLGGINNALGDSGGPFVCDLCGKRYVHHRSLNDHKKFHTGATTCQYCNKAFSKVANLRAHILAQHKDNGHDGYLHM